MTETSIHKQGRTMTTLTIEKRSIQKHEEMWKSASYLKKIH
ncbi:hypothetical protein [Methanobrevibacter sp.]